MDRFGDVKEFSAPSVLSFPWSSLWVCCPGCCIALIYTSSSSLSSKEFLFLLLRWSLLFLRVPSEVSWFYPWCLLSLGIVSQHKFFGGNQVDLLGGWCAKVIGPLPISPLYATVILFFCSESAVRILVGFYATRLGSVTCHMLK